MWIHIIAWIETMTWSSPNLLIWCSPYVVMVKFEMVETDQKVLFESYPW
jgi:hypothetical protein